MLRKVLNKVDDVRFSRALAGMQAGWQWHCGERRGHMLEGWSVMMVASPLMCRYI